MLPPRHAEMNPDRSVCNAMLRYAMLCYPILSPWVLDHTWASGITLVGRVMG